MGKKAAIAIIIFVIIVVFVGGLFAYSYTQLSVELNDVKFLSIDWETITWIKLIQLGLDTLSGNWLDAAFSLIQGINLNLMFSLNNNGLLPVYIPDFSYDVLINGILVGSGKSNVDAIIYPGQKMEIVSFQNIQKVGLSPAVKSLVESQGIMDLKIRGVAYFKLLGINVPIPFESSKQISIYDEIRNKLNAEIQKNKVQEDPLVDSIEKSLENMLNSIADELFGADELNLTLEGQTILDTVYAVKPGTYHQIPLELQCKSKVNGGFIANSPLGNNIIVYIFDQSNFDKFKNNQEFSFVYNSNKVESGKFDVILEPRTYHIVMSNLYSVVSEKSVQLKVGTLCI